MCVGWGVGRGPSVVRCARARPCAGLLVHAGAACVQACCASGGEGGDYRARMTVRIIQDIRMLKIKINDLRRELHITKSHISSIEALHRAGTGLAPPTSAPGLGSPLPHRRRDWARPHLHSGFAAIEALLPR